MNEELGIIIGNAVKEEEYYRDFYKKASERTTVISVKQILAKLSEQEDIHRERLLSLDPTSIEITDGADLGNLEVAKDLMLTPVNEFKDMKDILTFAVKVEARARDTYAHLGKITTDPKVKELFNMLAGEEEKHQDVLKQELANIEL